MELFNGRSLLLNSDECIQARSDLTNPRKRLAAEVAWLPGLSPKRTEKIMTWLSKPVQAMPTPTTLEALSPLARSNILASGLQKLANYSSSKVAEWILELAWAFEETDFEELFSVINEERIVSGFPEVTDLSALEVEIQERRHHYRKVIKYALDNLSAKELVEAVTVAVESATDDGEEHGPILIADLVDSYEVEAQAFLEKEEGNIKVLVEKLRAAVDAERPDSALAPMVNQLIQVVKNWDTVAQPIQVSTKSRGLDHDASHRVAGLVRGLAIHMYNEQGKLDFSQQLTNMLQEVFAEVGEVAERTAEDADALGEIAEQHALHSEVSKIKDLAEQIRADVDNARPDSHLSPKVGQLCQLVKNWDIDPEHDASQHAAWLVRDLAIHMFNKHDKLDFSQQLTKALLDIFADAGEISERIMEDAKVLREITANRNNLITQFREFNLNGNSFSYKGKTYSINDIRHIGFYRAITTHKTNFVETGKTEKANIYLTMRNGQEVSISVDEQGFFFNKNKSAQINTIVEFYSYLSHVTFDRRVEFYESQIRSNGYFVYDKCYFYPKDKIVFRSREFSLGSTSFFRGYGYVEMKKKDFGILDKIKREVSLTKIPQFSTIVDTDVIFHLLDKHFSLRWNS
jgi:polyhydroxyalkanoate synthesis regulator phasin